MKDLSNERDAVVRKIREIDFEPVNAEGWLPNGNKSWLKIQEEIDSSHIFVLLLGERYGWIPERGAGADHGQSVTHMELIRAQECGLPILPFIKRLSFDSERDSEDAKRRDALRREVTDWASGHFSTEFDLYHDLAIKVGASVVGLLADKYLSAEVQKRAILSRSRDDRLQRDKPSGPVKLPRRLVRALTDNELVMIAGPGISVAAGYPSESAISEFLASRLPGGEDFSERSIGAMPLPLMAQLFQHHTGRVHLMHTLERLLAGLRIAAPTEVHLQGVRLFETILTTNFDSLFEAAYHQQGIEFELVQNLMDQDVARSFADHRRLLVKLHGTMRDRDNLNLTDWNTDDVVLTYKDIWNTHNTGKPFGSFLQGMLRRKSALLIGLTDSTMYGDWFASYNDRHHYVVIPPGDPHAKYRYGRQFEVIEADQNDFIRALSTAVEQSREEV